MNWKALPADVKLMPVPAELRYSRTEIRALRHTTCSFKHKGEACAYQIFEKRYMIFRARVSKN
jgi:hypothetical protein